MMAKKARKEVDLPESTSVERKTTQVKEEFIPKFSRKIDDNKPTIYELIKHAKKRDGSKQYPVVSMMASSDIIYDPQTNTNRKIRYVKGEASIFVDEQSKTAKSVGTITFSNGFLYIDKTNPTLKSYLEHSNANKGNPNRVSSRKATFFCRDTQKDAKTEIEKATSIMEATQIALTMALDKLVGYAKVLGVNTNKSTDEIRWDMKVLAEKNPSGFLSGMNDPRTEIKQLLLLAKEMGVISIGKSGAKWASSGNIICVPAIGVNPLDRLVDFCSEGDGTAIYDEIERRLKAING